MNLMGGTHAPKKSSCLGQLVFPKHVKCTKKRKTKKKKIKNKIYKKLKKKHLECVETRT